MTAIDQSIVDPTNEQVFHLKLYDDEPTDQPTDQRAGFERWQLYDDELTNQPTNEQVLKDDNCMMMNQPTSRSDH